MTRFWRSRYHHSRSIHGVVQRGWFKIGYHAHLHDYIDGGKRLVLQPFLTIDFSR